MLNSRRIMHYIGAFTGTRTAIVVFNHASQSNLLVNAIVNSEATADTG